MSVDATRWAWQQTLPASQKLVLLSLADRADEEHKCYPSTSRLEKDTCLDRKTIMQAIRQLELVGLLCVSRAIGSANKYALIGVGERHITSTKNGTSTKTGTSTKNGTQPVPKTVLEPVPKTGHKPISEPNKNLKVYAISVEGLIADGVSEDCAIELLAARKRLKAELTPRAWTHIKNEIEKSGLTPDQAISTMLARGWRSFESEWVNKQAREKNGTSKARFDKLADTAAQLTGKLCDGSRVIEGTAYKVD